MIKITMKYNGRTFQNGRSLADAMTRDMNQKIERNLRQAASISGVQMRRTNKGFEITGDAKHVGRLNKKLQK